MHTFPNHLMGTIWTKIIISKTSVGEEEGADEGEEEEDDDNEDEGYRTRR